MTMEKNNHLKMYLLSKMVIFHCHVSFFWVGRQILAQTHDTGCLVYYYKDPYNGVW